MGRSSPVVHSTRSIAVIEGGERHVRPTRALFRGGRAGHFLRPGGGARLSSGPRDGRREERGPRRPHLPMSTHPLLIALSDEAALRSISGAFAAEGRAHHVTTDGGQLLGAVEGIADLIVDPRVAPDGQDPAAFMGEVVQRARGGRVLARCADQFVRRRHEPAAISPVDIRRSVFLFVCFLNIFLPSFPWFQPSPAALYRV